METEFAYSYFKRNRSLGDFAFRKNNDCIMTNILGSGSNDFLKTVGLNRLRARVCYAENKDLNNNGFLTAVGQQ